MAYLSELVGREVRDHRGNILGKLTDLLITSEDKSDYPRVMALVLTPNGKREARLIAWTGTEDLAGNKIVLQQPQPQGYAETGNEIYLARDVMDKQVIDTDDHRMVRVNDLELGKIGSDYRMLNVDIGGRGLLRRLGLEGVAERIAEGVHRSLPNRAVAWGDLNFLPVGGVQVKVPREKLKDLHPADIAEILEDVGPRLGSQLIQQMEDEKIADTLQELETDFQAEMLQAFPAERAADIVQEMEPDEAADLLNELEPERRQEILNQMEKEEKEEVQELLPYGEDTAGGMMTTKYVTVPPGITAGQAIEHLRQSESAKDAETIFYVYVTDGDEKLAGVCSLSDLVLASPDTPIESIMHEDPISVQLDAPRDKVLEEIGKYSLLALPVVNEENQMQGIVTADDALEMILPEELKVKLPRMFNR
ncbi:MAG: CBS domain-containing protein [Anaerolineae bacterium]